MKSAFNFKAIALATLTSAVLAACGGGGDGGGSTPATGVATQPSTPSTSTTTATALPPQTSIPATSYVAGSQQEQLFSNINSYRLALGVGLMRQDTKLDAAAAAHASYQQQNFATNSSASVGHDEVSSLPGFTGTTPLARAIAAGSPSTQFVGEVADSIIEASTSTAGVDCVNDWINSVYHLQGVTGNSESAGVGYAETASGISASSKAYFCVVDMGTSTGLTHSPSTTNAADGNVVPADGGQQVATNTVIVSPYAGETGVALKMHAEEPNPTPDITAPGRPIMVRVNDAQGEVLTLKTMQLFDSNGAAVAARLLVSSAAASNSSAGVVSDPNNLLGTGVVFLVPLAALNANTTYTVVFSGARAGTAISKTWSFTTAAQ